MKNRPRTTGTTKRWWIVVATALGLLVILAGFAIRIVTYDTPLNRAILLRDRGRLETVLGQSPSLNEQGRYGNTALHTAIEVQDKETYQKLLERHADPDICNHVGTSVMHLAAEQSDVYWIKEAFRHGGNPNQLNLGNRYFPDRTPIFYAINARRTECVLELIRAGADLNHKDGNASRPLEAAMGAGMYEAMIAMIKSGADPMAKLGPNQKVTILDMWKFDKSYESLISDDHRRDMYRRLVTLLRERGFLKN